LPIRAAGAPKAVVIPLHQHTGAPCDPVVKVGDHVHMGQLIGDSQAFVSAPVHASVSGKVVAIDNRPHPSMGVGQAVVIESDGLDTPDPSLAPAGRPSELTQNQIRQAIRRAGIVGLGGAAFPTAVKATPPIGKDIEVVMLNGAECEPYLTADHRVMLEETSEVIDGLHALIRACGARRGLVAVEDNKLDAVAALRQAIEATRGADVPEIKIVLLHTKYPQGSEKQLVWACTGREVPSGGLPLDVGAVVNNVATAVAVSRALSAGTPLYERVVTVTGSAVAQPQNLRVRVGATFGDLIAQCGGFSKPVGKIINGGPMMGIAQATLDVPVIKGTSGILCLGRDEAEVGQPGPCLKCGRCVDGCPMHLAPLWIAAYGERGIHEEAERLGAMDCVECGCCSFICPARRPLVQAIRLSKGEITARRRREAQRAAEAKK
jgi:electron transport complex protein RnfC